MAELLVIARDLDDTDWEYNEPFMWYIGDDDNISLGRLADANSYNFAERYPNAIYQNGQPVDWAHEIDEFTLGYSVELLKLKKGVLDHYEKFARVVRPVAVTSRPARHRAVTERLIRKYLSDYYNNFAEQLILPSEVSEITGILPSKLEVAETIGAIAIIDDNVKHLRLTEDHPSTKVERVLYTDKETTWNHDICIEGIKRAVGWSNGTRILGEIFERRQSEF